MSTQTTITERELAYFSSLRNLPLWQIEQAIKREQQSGNAELERLARLAYEAQYCEIHDI